MKKKIKVDPMGYWNPENQGKPVIIPSNQITMEGVDFPVLGVADNGKKMVMYPYQNYNFEGARYVTEYPLTKKGSMKNKVKAQDGANIDPLSGFKADNQLNFTSTGYNKKGKTFFTNNPVFKLQDYPYYVGYQENNGKFSQVFTDETGEVMNNKELLGNTQSNILMTGEEVSNNLYKMYKSKYDSPRYQSGISAAQKSGKTISFDEGGKLPVYQKPSIGGGQFLPIKDATHYAQEIPIAEQGHYIRKDNSNYFIKDIYQDLEEAQSGKRLPITTNNPNDPRLKAYNDSLKLYNSGQVMLRAYKDRPKKWVKAGHPDTDNSNMYQYPDPDGTGYDFKISPTWKALDPEHLTEQGWVTNRVMFNVYKNPEQPVVYHKPQQKSNINTIRKPLVKEQPDLNMIGTEKPGFPSYMGNIPSPTNGTLSAPQTDYSVTWGEDGKQESRYFPNYDSWKNFNDSQMGTFQWQYSDETKDKSRASTLLKGRPEMRTGGKLRWNQAQSGQQLYGTAPNNQSQYMWNQVPNIISLLNPKSNQVQDADMFMDNTMDAKQLDMRPQFRTNLGQLSMQSVTPEKLQTAPNAKRRQANEDKKINWSNVITTGLAAANFLTPEKDPIQSNAPKMEDTMYAPWNTPSYGRGSQAIAKNGLQIHGDYNMDDITRMEQGGELNVHWGGEAEPISYNPIDGQETVLFKGASHDQGGIGIDFQGNPVEVQGGEPAVKDEQGNLNILGGLKVPGQKYTFQTLGKKLAKQENKFTKQLNKGTEFVNNATMTSKFDILSMNTGKAMMLGATEKLQKLSDKKQDVIALQNALLDTSEELNLDSKALSEGRIKKGKSKDNAQYGSMLEAFGPVKGNTVNPVLYNYLSELYNKAKTFEGKGKNEAVLKFQKEYHRLVPQFAKQVLESEPVTNFGKQNKFDKSNLKSNEDKLFGKRTVRYMEELQKYKTKPYTPQIQPSTPKQDVSEVEVDNSWKNRTLQVPSTTTNLGTAAQDLAFYQVAPELTALATNRVRPVPTFGIQQDLYQPYKVSFQDQRNANASTFRAMQEQLGYNPTFMSTLAAQKYQADQQSLSDEFRINQAVETDVINKNLGIVNETRNKNLQLQSDQWLKQEMARANTRRENLGILSSVSSKVGQNKLEQARTKLYENLFKYRPNSNWQMEWKGGDADLFSLIDPTVKERKTKVTEKDGDKTTQVTTTQNGKNGMRIAQAVKNIGKYNSLG